MSELSDWGEVAGVGRDILEERLKAAVAAVEAVEERLTGRLESALRSAATHPDARVRDLAAARGEAYRTAIEDVRGAVSATKRCPR